MQKNNVKQLKQVIDLPPENPVRQDLVIEYEDVTKYVDTEPGNCDGVIYLTETFENVKGFSLSSHWVSITKEDGNSIAIPYGRIRNIQQSYKD